MSIYKIVDKHTGEPIWGVNFGSLKAAKLSVQINNFIASAVGIAQFTDGIRSSSVLVFNKSTTTWEEN
jgi:hypothetical protein